MAKYLDENGLLYFWQKIKAVFAAKTDLPGVVSKTANGLAPQLPNELTTTKFLRQDGSWEVPPGVTTVVNGSANGLAPQLPATGGTTKFLRGDGSWEVPPDTIYSAATQSAAGLMSSTDKTKLDGFGQASTYALKTDIASMYKYKGSVATASTLPSSGQEVGDVYNIEAASTYGGAGMNVAWNGTTWDPLGEIFSITAVTNGEIDTIVAS